MSWHLVQAIGRELPCSGYGEGPPGTSLLGDTEKPSLSLSPHSLPYKLLTSW